MKFKISILLGFLFLFCHKDIMLQNGYVEIKQYDWKVNEAENVLNLKYWLIESPVDTIKSMMIKLNVEGIDLENTFTNLTVKLDNDKNSLHTGTKCVEASWSPAIQITKKNIKKIRVYIK